jgi:hypothetical protein
MTLDEGIFEFDGSLESTSTYVAITNTGIIIIYVSLIIGDDSRDLFDRRGFRPALKNSSAL